MLWEDREPRTGKAEGRKGQIGFMLFELVSSEVGTKEKLQGKDKIQRTPGNRKKLTSQLL